MTTNDRRAEGDTMQGGTPESLKRHTDWLYPNSAKPCRCDHAYVGLGRMHGINMGNGWVRTTTHPNCYHHGTAAQKTYKTTGRWPSHA